MDAICGCTLCRRADRRRHRVLPLLRVDELRSFHRAFRHVRIRRHARDRPAHRLACHRSAEWPRRNVQRGCLCIWVKRRGRPCALERWAPGERAGPEPGARSKRIHAGALLCFSLRRWSLRQGIRRSLGRRFERPPDRIDGDRRRRILSCIRHGRRARRLAADGGRKLAARFQRCELCGGERIRGLVRGRRNRRSAALRRRRVDT